MVGNNNIKVFNLNISEKESLNRTMGRLICEKNRHSIPNLPEFQEIRKSGVCPEDGSKLIKKSLDNPTTLKSRLAEHNNRTLPVFDYLKERGYEIMEINGEQPIDDVYKDIVEKLKD